MDAVDDKSGRFSELSQRFANGDYSVVGELQASIGPGLIAWLMRNLRNLTQAEDVAQDVWVKVLEKGEQFTGGNFRSWVFQIARTTQVDHVRKLKRRRETAVAQGANEPPVIDDAVEAEEMRRVELEAFKQCLDELNQDFAQAILRTTGGEMPEDLAEELNVSVNTIYGRVKRGKDRLTECVQKRISG